MCDPLDCKAQAVTGKFLLPAGTDLLVATLNEEEAKQPGPLIKCCGLPNSE